MEGAGTYLFVANSVPSFVFVPMIDGTSLMGLDASARISAGVPVNSTPSTVGAHRHPMKNGTRDVLLFPEVSTAAELASRMHASGSSAMQPNARRTFENCSSTMV